MSSLLTYKVILWDFDGVLMDSMPVRDKGFEEVLKAYPQEHVALLMGYHKANGGLSRYVKFRYFYEQIRKETVTEDRINMLATRFSEIMLSMLIDEKLLITDSWNFIKQYHTKIPMHIVSGSDGVELNKICSSLSVSSYFKSIHGSPMPKKEIIKQLLQQHYADVNPDEIILIGDSVNDLDAAMYNNIKFAGYNNPSLNSNNHYYINSFSSL